jgi:hypothetical protein
MASALLDLPALVGLGATGLSVGAFLLKGPRRILALSTMGSLTWILHFSLLGAWAGAATAFGSSIRNGAGAWLDRRAMVWFTWVAAITVIAVGLLVDPRGYVILLAAPIRAIANHLRDYEIPFRLVSGLSGVPYVIYAFTIGSYVVLLSSVLTTSVVIGAPAWKHIRERRAVVRSIE